MAPRTVSWHRRN